MTKVSSHLVNDDIFFLIHDGAFVAWNYKLHRQHVLSLDSMRALIDLKFRGEHPALTDVLLGAQVLVEAAAQSKRKWGWDLLSKIFHLGTSRTKPEPFIPNAQQEARDYIDYCASIMKDMPSDAFCTSRGTASFELDLPTEPIEPGLERLLAQRKSNRTFTGENIPFSKVSYVLDETFRYREHDKHAYDKMGMYTPAKRRSSPSGGSLQSCEAYLIARKVTGLPPAIYHLRSHLSNLGLVRPLSEPFSFGSLFGGQMFADDLSAAIIMSCRFDKFMWKYRQSRSYRVALLDAGHLSQTAQLLATSVGIRTWVTAAFFDDELSGLLALDDRENEFPLLAIGLGTGEFNAFDRDLGTGFVRC